METLAQPVNKSITVVSKADLIDMASNLAESVGLSRLEVYNMIDHGDLSGTVLEAELSMIRKLLYGQILNWWEYR